MAITERYVSSDSADTTWADSTSSSTPVTLATAIANAAAGDRVNIKAGSGGGYDRTTTADTWGASAGTITSPVVWRGVDTSWNPIAPARANGNGLLVTTGMPVITYTTGAITLRAFNVLQDLSLTSAKSGPTLTDAADTVVFRCLITNTSTNTGAVVLNIANSRTIVLNCDVLYAAASGGATYALIRVAGTGRLLFNRISGSGGNTAVAVRLEGTGGLVIGNIIYAGKNHHISHTATGCWSNILFNTLVDPEAASCSGITFVDGTALISCIVGNQITDQTANAIDAFDGDVPILEAFNRFTRNTANFNGATDWLAVCGWGDVTGAQAGANAAAQRAAEYSAPDSRDYRLKTAALGKSAALPAYADIGACQRQENTFPAAGDVETGSGTYGDVLEPTTPTFGVPAVADVRTGVGFGAAGTEFTGTLIKAGAASGGATLSKETGANARGGSGTCWKLTSTAAYGYLDFYVPVTASTPFTLTFYHMEPGSPAFNGTVDVTIYDTDDATPLLTNESVTLSTTYAQHTCTQETPTATGFCRIRFRVQKGAATAAAVYLDDFAGV